MSENESNRGWQWLLPISLVADVSAVVTVLAGSASVLWLVLGSVALLLGVGQVVLKFGKPVDTMVLLAVVGIVLGTVALTVGAVRSFPDTPGQASGSTTSSQPNSTTPSSPTGATTPPAPSTKPSVSLPPASSPDVRRETAGNKPMALTNDYSLDLDSTAAAWISVPTTAETTATEDIYYRYGTLHAGKDLAFVDKEPSQEDCVHAGYHPEYGSNKLVAGNWFCVKTSEGHHARIKVRERTYESLSLDVLVWNKTTS
ncbi:hypothetical protein ACIA8G_24625 [Lentzea sp. NPDC051213]|uniref:hypothetical protein n=1 Tax=Lentzea sp. NPDC051213 TaxID=3364126 RepID=UPI0037B9338B